MDGEPLDGYRFQLRCRYCGGECLHVTGGQHTSFDANAITQCADCHKKWLVTVALIDPEAAGRVGFARSRRKDAGVTSMAKARAAKVTR